MTTAERRRIGRCCRCGTSERRTNPDGTLSYVCAACAGEIGVSEGASLRAIEARYPGDRQAQRQAAMVELGWKGGWR